MLCWVSIFNFLVSKSDCEGYAKIEKEKKTILRL